MMNILEDIDPWNANGRSNNDHFKPTLATTTTTTTTTAPMAVPSYDELSGVLSKNEVLDGSIWGEPAQKPVQEVKKSKDDAPGATRVTSLVNEQAEFESWSKSLRKSYNPLSIDLITVEEIPEREGMLFKHTNYLVKNSLDMTSSNNSVVRRYSDFIWLQEILIKIYPFRLIPELPPKKIGSSQNLDRVFMERRRRGLKRFINLILKHPLLKNDKFVNIFLTFNSDINSYKKQNNFNAEDELTTKELSPFFKKIWKKEFAENWNIANNTIDKLINTWTKIAVMVERYEKRLKQIAHEKSALNSLINELTDLTPKLYPVEHSDTILDINNHLGIVNQHLVGSVELTHDTTAEYTRILIPKFKIFVDILVSLKNLFERYRMLGGNNIAQLYKHVQNNTEKLESMKGKPDSSGAEYDKIRTTISVDKKSIMEQSNKAWLIRECILEEFIIFQETQFLISTAFQDWVRLNSNFAGLNMNEWEKLMDQLVDMPTYNKD
ncbi:hypothetical protein Kpol_1037p15 [Vanderwaltozyma polyspora DSM 70294]|uniref:Sorting nexin MVP1 n=1 Tax=Vanderwaltozyma polyspora (strain ATCC 22028 / DSM 70294 / BCRC 21397 / CBS 2163 / NBRC 10782 / NRRL Y-8283 / UCD 57-17) TaxID=436907 RepID=A7TJV7_VANPO|nr:uncharacterized protein Kpol_1037p15 [Vanderwaltozyma polyspora DSM 70294]EDO17419.1 hypothetical protein Kpol_1037p15 [Vanderwaltozyma polyspora DSM 70294]